MDNVFPQKGKLITSQNTTILVENIHGQTLKFVIYFEEDKDAYLCTPVTTLGDGTEVVQAQPRLLLFVAQISDNTFRQIYFNQKYEFFNITPDES